MSLDLKPSHASVKAYYDTLHQFGQLYIDHEGAVRSAFQDLLAKCGRKAKPPLTLVPEYRIERARSSVIVDGALVDLYHLPHGYWEAKDEKDDLAREVERKLDKGYPRDNIIFQAPERAILYQSGARIYQSGARIFDDNITRPEALPATATAPSRSGTSSITSTPFCTIPSIASATPPTYAASCPAFRSSARPQGAKAQLEGAPNAALKRRSSTVTSSRSSTVTSSNDGVRVGASVEERPFRAASEQEDSRALAPVPSDLDVFHAFASAGQRLAGIHVHYEQQPEYPLTKTEKAGEKLDYRVTKMRLSKDKTSLIYNQVPHPKRHSTRHLRIPPRQPLGVGMGD